MLLSGTRIGFSLSLVGAFERFGEIIGLSDAALKFMAGLEALFGFLTVEGLLFASGYYFGVQLKKLEPRYEKIVVWTGIIIALVANVSPVALRLGTEALNITAIGVNVIVGIGTPIIVIIMGMMLSGTFHKSKTVYDSALEQWQETARNIWNDLYAEYKKDFAAWQKTAGHSFRNYEQKHNKATHNDKQEKRLIETLKKQPGTTMPIVEAATALGISERKILQITSASSRADWAGADVKLTNGNH